MKVDNYNSQQTVHLNNNPKATLIDKDQLDKTPLNENEAILYFFHNGVQYSLKIDLSENNKLFNALKRKDKGRIEDFDLSNQLIPALKEGVENKFNSPITMAKHVSFNNIKTIYLHSLGPNKLIVNNDDQNNRSSFNLKSGRNYFKKTLSIISALELPESWK